MLPQQSKRRLATRENSDSVKDNDEDLSIPFISFEMPAYEPFHVYVENILASSDSITVFCGPNINLQARIPDELARHPALDRSLAQRGCLRTSDIFSSRAIKSPIHRLHYSHVFACMRIAAREASLRARHRYIEHLFLTGRLDLVVQIHGTNTHLRCTGCGLRPDQATSMFDEDLVLRGRALCPSCPWEPQSLQTILKKQPLQVLPRPRLLPDVMLDDDSTQLWAGNDKLNTLMPKDAKCDVLLILGPRLKSKGAALVIKSLARKGDDIQVSGNTMQTNHGQNYLKQTSAYLNSLCKLNMESTNAQVMDARNPSGTGSARGTKSVRFI
ncbi:hypothetical protein RSAG8_11591, partial [Rhizoctonia solani AG-8 WAC10335]